MDTGGHVNQEQPHEDTDAGKIWSGIYNESKNAHQVLSSDFLEG